MTVQFCSIVSAFLAAICMWLSREFLYNCFRNSSRSQDSEIVCEKPGVTNQGPGHKPFLFGRVCLSFPGGGDHPSFLSERGAGSGVKASGCHLHVAACQRWGRTMPLSREPRAPARRLLSGLPASVLRAPGGAKARGSQAPGLASTPGLLGLPVPVVSSFRCLCRDPAFFSHQDSCQASCSDVPPPAPSSSSASPGGPGNTQSLQRVGIPGSWPQPRSGSLGNEPVEPGLRFPHLWGEGRVGRRFCSALHSTHWQWTWLLHATFLRFPRQPRAWKNSASSSCHSRGVLHAVASVPSTLSPMLRQAHAAGCLPSAPHGPGWYPTQWAPAWPVDVCADKPACPSVLPALSPGPPPSWNQSVPSGRARRTLLSPWKPLPPEGSRLAHGERVCS